MHAFRIFIITTAGVKCLCGSCKKPPRTPSQCSYLYNYKVERNIQSSWIAQSVEHLSCKQGVPEFEPRSGWIFFLTLLYLSVNNARIPYIPSMRYFHNFRSETVCSGERSYEREIIQCSPVAAIRVYEYCLSDRISLDDILNSKQVNINGRVYHLAGITMHRDVHYCAIVMFNKKLLWYDGLLGRLVVLPKNLQEWFPSHMIYCCV